MVLKGGWNIADCVERAYDLEGMHVGTVAAGRIGTAVLRRLKPFDVKLHYTDRHRLPAEVEKELGLTFHENREDLFKVCDVITLNTPLHPETEHMFNDKTLATMKRGTYLVNTARGKICDRDAIVARSKADNSRAMPATSGTAAGAEDHPWRTMPHEGMTPHTSGTSLSAQARYAAARARFWNVSSPASRSATNISLSRAAISPAWAHIPIAWPSNMKARRRNGAAGSVLSQRY